MKLIFKILAVFFIFIVLFAVSYLLFGEQIEIVFSKEKCIQWFLSAKSYAWIGGILLLISDILLPVPATGIMAAIGAVYGLWPGIIISFAGSMLAGLTGYAAALFFGKKGSRYIASENEISRFKSYFDSYGGYAVILSRAVPVMPEAITILAGLSGMKFSRFSAALIAGTLPVSFFFTWLGTSKAAGFGGGLILAVLIPALVWPFFIKFLKI
jgi:uncharacterized membrane protein YdjX (TVP38/TMEM64 family)